MSKRFVPSSTSVYRRRGSVPAPTYRRRGPAVGGDRSRSNRECRECFGFPYHVPGCSKTE